MNYKTKKILSFSILFSIVFSLFAIFGAFFIQVNNWKLANLATATTNDSAQNISVKNWADIDTKNTIQIYNNSTEQILAISSPEGLAAFMQDVNSGTNKYTSVYLTNDIDLSGKIWTPIKSFGGIFDGRGYTIKGLTIDETVETSDHCNGLFGQTSGAIIKNLTLEGVNINSKYSNEYAGALIGKAENTQIINCGATGTVSGGSSVGGLVGYLNGSINRCFSYVNTTSTSVEYLYGRRCTFSGGLVGYYVGGNGNNFDLVFHYGNVYTTVSHLNAVVGLGGIAGFVYDSSANQNSENIKNYYCSSDIGYSYGTIGNAVVKYSAGSRNEADSSYWIEDTNGIMHGIAKQFVIRGVGNIVLHYENNKFLYEGDESVQNPGTNNTTHSYNSTSNNTYLYNILTKNGNINDVLEFESESNYTFEKVVFSRTISGESDNLIRGYENFFQYVDDGNTYRYNEKSLSAESKVNSSVLKFSLNDAGSDDFSFNVSSSNYELSVLKTFQGEYTIVAYERGKYIPVTFSFLEYKNVTKSAWVSVTKNNLYEIKLVDGKYADLSAEDVYYVPYDEPYIITFTSDYFKRITQIGKGGLDATNILFDKPE